MDDSLSRLLTFHHVGCVVKDMARAIEAYRPLARSIGPIQHIAAQNVRICFLETGPGVYIELIESAGEGSAVAKLVKTSVTFYHVGFLVSDFDAVLGSLVEKGYLHLNTFRSEAFGMRRCAFLACPVAHLVEIMEDQSAAPRQHLPI